MKSLYLLTILCTHLTALPPPYSELTEVLPFVDHGWFGNAAQLQELIETNEVKTVIEVGSWLGQSTIFIAKQLPSEGKVYAIDHWKGSSEHQPGMKSWEPFLPYLYEQFLSNVIAAGQTEKIIPIRLSSLEAARVVTVQPDLIYLDGDHSTAGLYSDLCVWYPFVENGGILCGDDWRWESVRKAVRAFASQKRLKIEASNNFWRLTERKKR